MNSDPLDLAIQAYHDCQFEQAIELLRPLAQSESPDRIAVLYMAMSYDKMRIAPAARRMFSQFTGDRSGNVRRTSNHLR